MKRLTKDYLSGSEDVPYGVKKFIETAYYGSYHLDAGNPETHLGLRVKTSVTRFEHHGNTIVILLHPMNTRYSKWRIARYMNLMNPGIKRLEPDHLPEIGMEPGKCHPFPDPNLFCNPDIGNGLDYICVDSDMVRSGSDFFFPIFPESDSERIGSIVMNPKVYIETMSHIIGENRISEEKIIDEEYVYPNIPIHVQISPLLDEFKKKR